MSYCTTRTRIMDTFWNRGACSIREIQEAFPERGRPAYTTVHTTVYRLERDRSCAEAVGKLRVALC
jgi:predicted transcriptional regulator